MFATMMKYISKTDVILIVGMNHMFVGFRGTPRQGEAFVTYSGFEYVLVELTVPTPLGMIGPEFVASLRGRELDIVPIQ